ncbi:Triosephosphate isomerase [Patulibacter medicamentivorans]|jgi:triosephosphate isomerase|uniref:Triosephosphate isomerase n=1 Tax=Patulibacter medicamentivorans TaxID=1097667 RepID=H0E677_9ACTN|nr:triose-phosphate isomerase [Patulibacter medicamentivorans]EHN10846.1 Triosephosphate isomerase [Patulibacter medicamentivorans]
MTRTPFVAGNWKMHKTIAEAEAFVSGALPLVGAIDDVQIGVCVPFPSIQAVVDSTRGSSLQVYAQNVHWAEQGAYTGEVSVAMLDELEVAGVVVGHSERRQFFGETDADLRKKLPVILAAGLEPIFCVGETEEQREAGETERVLRHQVQEGLHDVADGDLAKVTIAYEPIWAIGTGKVATPEQAQEACAFVRALVAARDAEQGEQVRIQYGGSVKPENAAELLALPDVDGALVGGAALDPASFAAIVEAARA